MTLGKKIRICRKMAELKQCELAKRIGVTNNTLCNYEHDCFEPSAFGLACIADALGVSMDWLIDRTPKAEWEDNQWKFDKVINFLEGVDDE